MKTILSTIMLLALYLNLVAQNNFILQENFNNNVVDPAIVFSPNLEGVDGRVEVVDNEGINTSPGVFIGKFSDGDLTRNGLDIHLEIADSSDVFLSFFIRDFFEENHFQDGLYFSNDGGASFVKAYSFLPEDWCNNTWGEFPPFSIDDLAAEIGMTFTNNFVVRIQQYDNADFNSSFDEDGFIIDNIAVYTKHPSYSNLPFEDDFDNGFYKGSWTWGNPAKTMFPIVNSAKPTGFAKVLDQVGTNGTPGVRIGKICDDGLTANALDLHLNLAGKTDVYLSFLIKDFFEENNIQDGLFFSDDGGNTFEQVYTFYGADWCNQWGEFPPFHVDGLAAAAGLEMTSTFIIRFQQYDNADFNTSSDEDGFDIDNVLVEERSPVFASLPFMDNFDNSNNGVLGPSWNWAHGDLTVMPLTNRVKPSGFVGIVDAIGIGNTPALRMGKRCDDGLTVNALDLHLNLDGLSDVYLSFNIRDFFEEKHNQDGLFFSDDGGNSFHQVYTFQATDWCNNWGGFPPFPVDVMAAAAGLDLTSTFVIRFQQYDDADFNTSSDEDGFDIDNVLVEQRSSVYASLPFMDNFDNSNDGALGPSWSWAQGDSTVAPLENRVKSTGFVGIVDAIGTGGTPGVRMGKICDDGLTVNALDLHLDLGGLSDVYFSFSIKDFFDENNIQDGLFFSDDGGISFHQVYIFKPTEWCNSWGSFPPFHVDAMAAAAGLNLTSNFIIRIQQYDDADFNTSSDEDGIDIDNVLVQQRTPVYATLPFTDNFNNSNNGELGPSWRWSHGDSTVVPIVDRVKPTGFVGIVDNIGTNNTPGLRMGKICDDGLTVNALDLYLNLENQEGVVLCFDLLDFFNENHFQDALFFSNDGGLSFTEIFKFDYDTYPNNQFTGTPVTIDIDDLTSSLGIPYSDQSVLRFQQYDDADFNTASDEDGIILDNILIKTDIINSSTEEDVSGNKFTLIPNPATNLLRINASYKIEKILILDVNGRVVINIEKGNNQSEEVDVSSLRNGVYFVQIFNKHGVGTEKIVKQ